MSESGAPTSPVPGLRVDLLGAPFVAVDGHPLAVDTRKAVAVLAVLAVSTSTGRTGVPRAELADLLWPEVDAHRARGSLRRTLSVLLAATGPTVVADRSEVALVPATLTSDVVTFRQLAACDNREDLARGVGLVRGELLSGFALRDSPAFDEWCLRESDALRRELGAVLERLVVARLRHGELHAGLADAARWVELDPLHEAAHRSVMRLLAWTGRRQDALDQYQRCVRLLGDELGVAPVRATTEVYEAVRSGTLPPPRRPSTAPRPHTAPASSPPATPPTASVPLVGRDQELAALRASLGAGDRLMVVTGEAGSGRSRLVEEFAAHCSRDGRPALLVRAHGGEATLSFAPVADLVRGALALGGPPPDDVADEIARLVPEVRSAARRPEPPLTTPGARDLFFDAVVRVLAGCGAAAIVVEDVHAAGAATAEVLAYVVHRLHRLSCPVVLTWREPGLDERHPVRAAVATRRSHEPLVPAGDAAAMGTTEISLGRLARDEVASLVHAVNPEQPADADAVWRDTADLPLLVVAALRSGAALVDDLPLTVRDLLAARLAEVSEETSQVLTALAVLDGVAEPGDLQAASGRTDVETVDAVEEALRVGLVREERRDIAFTHDVLRRVAYDRLSLPRRRLLHGRAADTLAARRDADERAGTIATHLHLAGRDEQAVAWAWRAAQRSRLLYAHADCLHELELVASLGRDDADVALARGDALVALGRYDDARAALRRALAFGGPASTCAGIERRLADIDVRLGEWSGAAAGLDAAIELLESASESVAANDDRGVLRARLLADRAIVALRAGDLAEAAEFVARAETATTAPQAYVLNTAGIVASTASGTGPPDPAAATARFEQALSALGDTPEPVLEAAVRNNLASAQAAAGDAAAAVETARAALALGARLGDRHRLAALHANLADRLHEVDDSDAAVEELKRAAALFAEVGSDPLDRPDVWTLTTW